MQLSSVVSCLFYEDFTPPLAFNFGDGENLLVDKARGEGE